MSLTTASLPRLRAESNAAIVDLEAKLENGALPSRQQRTITERLQGLFDKRLELETATITKKQRESYGLERWDRDFIRLQDVRVLEGSRLSGDQIRNIIWRMVPNSTFKRFQELFCDPQNFIVPRFTVDQRGRLAFVREPDWGNLSVHGCLVSVDRIPDEFAEKTKLLQFTPKERRSPLLRYMRKSDIHVIDSLKLLWDSSRPVRSAPYSEDGPPGTGKDLRVLAIRRPEATLANQYPNAAPFPIGLHGSVLYTREDFSDRVTRKNPILGPQKVAPLRIQHFPTIYDAHRKTLHARRSYEQEQPALTAIRSDIQALLVELNRDWRRGAPDEVKEALRARVKSTLGEGIKLLEPAVDRRKRNAHDLLALVEDVRDSRGRTNPSVAACRMSYALRDLQERLAETYDKSGFNERDRGILSAALTAEARILSRVRKTLAERTEAVFGPESRRCPPASAINSLVPDRDSLSSIQYRPFSTFAGLLRVGVAELEKGLRAGQRTKSEEAVVKMYVVTKFFAAKVIVESMKDRIAGSDTVPVEDLRKHLSDLAKVLTLTILPNVTIRPYQEKFEQLLSGVAGLQSKLDAYSGAEGTMDEKRFIRSFRKALDAFNPERLAWDLVPARWRQSAKPGTEPVNGGA